MSVIETNNLQKRYQVGENSVHAVDGVDLNIREGRIRLHQRAERFRKIHALKPAGRTGKPYGRRSSDFWANIWNR